MMNYNDVLRLAGEPPSGFTPWQLLGGAAVSSTSGTPTDIKATLETAANLPGNITGFKWTTMVRLVLKADPGNTGTIFIGNNSAGTNTGDKNTGYPLGAGDSVEIAMNPSQTPQTGQVKYYAVGSAAGQKLYVVAVVPTP